MLIAGNWKMNTDVPEGRALAQVIADRLSTSSHSFDGVDFLVCPPFVHLPAVIDALDESPVAVGAQDMHAEDEGAYTGDVSAPMLTSVGCDSVILGHSERREYYDETDADVNAKVTQARAHDLVPIVCVGETLEQRQAGDAKAVVRRQVDGALEDVSVGSSEELVVAYEPVWAIGTGVTPGADEIAAALAVIRRTLRQRVDAVTADGLRLLYGGSVKPANAGELCGIDGVDGLLVGAASLSVERFRAIGHSCCEARHT